MRVGALATSMTSQVSPQVTLALEEYERIFGSQPYYWAATRCLVSGHKAALGHSFL